MSHHSDRPPSELFRARLGPTREFPRGKLNPSDAGEIKIAIARDSESKTVIIDFGSPVKWIGFSGEQAAEIGELLIKHANALRGIS